MASGTPRAKRKGRLSRDSPPSALVGQQAFYAGLVYDFHREKRPVAYPDALSCCALIKRKETKEGASASSYSLGAWAPRSCHTHLRRSSAATASWVQIGRAHV